MTVQDAALLILAVFAALTVLVVVLVLAAQRKRVERIERWTRENDWYLVRRPEVGWCDRLPGRNRHGTSLLVHGTAHGHPVAVAEYSHTTSSSTPDGNGGTRSTTTTHHYVVTVVGLAAAHPPVAVLPRGALSRLGRALFGDRPTAVGHPEFDQLFRVRTRDPDVAHALLGKALVAEHLAERVPFWDLAGHELLTWEPGRLTEPTTIPARADALVRVAQLLGR